MKNKLFSLLFLMIIALGNVQAYNLTGISPSNHVLYFNILDSENHTLGVTYPCNGGNDNYYYNYTKPEGNLIIPATITIGQNTWTIIEITDHAFYECNITSVEIPNTVTSIGRWAFYRTHIKYLTLPESLNTLGEYVFSSSWLTSVTLPEKDLQYGNGCFSTTELTTVVIPEGVTIISSNMFHNCHFLKNVSFPSTLTRIDKDAFSYCTSLQAIHIPSSVIAIGVWELGIIHNPFRGASKLASISVDYNNPVYYSEGNCIIKRDTKTIISGCKNSVIPNDVVEIGVLAFESMMSGTLYLPASVNNIGQGAFYNCSSLTKIYSFNPNPPSLYVNNTVAPSFAHVPMTIPVYVPAGCIEAYQNAPGWNEFENIVEMEMFPIGTEWYYEIFNDNGSITYQYLECAADTTINDQPIHILVRINTLYDKEKYDVTTHEYIYEENNKVYWWNKTLGEFTTLYDFGAEVGDEWEIKVGTQTIPVHVDAAQTVTYKSQEYKMLSISDPDDIFTGDIICGIGHLTSFFPEKLMNKGYRVENIRCFWQDGELVYQNGDQDCDEIYEQHHLDVDEIDSENNFAVYPNPSHDVLYVLSDNINSEYRVTNLMGQTLMIGEITSENQMIDVSSLTKGIYFITINNESQKFVIK